MTLTLADVPLKHFLRLFDAAAPMQILELGDTWHPSRGYVDESISGKVERVEQLLAYDYDFRGLVYFEAYVQDVAVKYQQNQYELHGKTKALEQLLSQIRALNALDEELKFDILAKG